MRVSVLFCTYSQYCVFFSMRGGTKKGVRSVSAPISGKTSAVEDLPAR